jgi:hypothetical protein
VTFVYTLFAIGIARSWELLGLQGGGPLDLLTRRLHMDQPPSRTSPAPPVPPDAAPGTD